jgi:hypothetical protein
MQGCNQCSKPNYNRWTWTNNAAISYNQIHLILIRFNWRSVGITRVERQRGASSVRDGGVRPGGVRPGGGVRYNITKFIVYDFCLPNGTTVHPDIDLLFQPFTSLTILIFCAFSQYSVIKFLFFAILHIKSVDYRRSMCLHSVHLATCCFMMCILAAPFRQL